MAGGAMGPFAMAVHRGTTFINSRPAGRITGSDNFIWYDGDRLGEGATGAVFVGRNKKTGDLCAIKTFNDASRKRHPGVQIREFEVLRKLDHVNVVKMIAMEEELGKKNRVLVMELCTGGSLFSILDHASNQFGLEEAEFLLVLEHVTNGMKHLRDKNLIHRDLKPGNIMRFVTESGDSVYKLVDFGAARELEDEEQFQSLYGTEEYLLPDMYEYAVLKQNREKQFGAQCDLWSLGVTFYHAATGSLPFRPFGGRKNRPMLHKITTMKEPGVISGVQHTEGGQIEWSRTLPSTCRLSEGLKELIRQLLAGMLEPEASKMVKFDRFFEFVNSIVKITPVHVFNVASGDFLRIYTSVQSRPSSASQPQTGFKKVSGILQDLEEESCIPSMHSKLVANVQDAIARQTDIPAKDQFLIFDGVSLDPGLGIRDDGGGDGCNSIADSMAESITESILLETQVDNPIFVLPRTWTSMQLTRPVLPPFDDYFSEVDLSKDSHLAKQYCSVMYGISRQITSSAKVQQLLKSVQKIMSRSLKSSVEKLENFMRVFRNHFDLLTSYHSATTDRFRQYKEISPAPHTTKDSTESIDDLMEKSESFLKNVDDSMRNLKEDWLRFVQIASSHISEATRCYEFRFRGGGCNDGDSPCSNTITAMIEETTRIVADFKADKRQADDLPFNTEQIHKYDKHNLNLMRERAMSKFQDHCYHNSKQAHERLIGWYQDALKYLHALESQLSPLKFQLECQRQNVEKSLHQFSTELSHIHSYVLKIAAQKIRNDLSPEGQKMSRKITGLMEKLTKETERTKVTVGQNNDILRNVTLGLEGLEVVDTNPAAFAIGGSEGFFRPDCPGYY